MSVDGSPGKRLSGIIASLRNGNAAQADVQMAEPCDDQPQSVSQPVVSEEEVTPRPPIMDSAPEESVAVSGTVCSECSTLIHNPANLVVHMRRHLGYKPYTCSRCVYTGYDEDDVRRHAQRSHPSANQSSAFVRFNAQRESEEAVQAMMDKSRTVEREHQKDDVIVQDSPPTQSDSLQALTNGTTDPISLMQALIGASTMPPLVNKPSVSSNGQPDSQNVSVPVPVTCAMCNTSVTTDIPAVIRHLKCHLQAPGYVCPFCPPGSVAATSKNGVQFSSWSELAAHLSVAHPAQNQKTADVSQLARLAYSKALLSTAELAFGMLGDEMPCLTCQLCADHVPLRWHDVEVHVSEHNRNNPYKCSVCMNPFVDLSSLRTHFLRLHADAFFVYNFVPNLTPDAFGGELERAFPPLSVESLEMVQTELQSFMTAMMPTASLQQAMAHMGKSAKSQLDSQGTDDVGRATVTCQVCAVQISRNMSCLIAHAKVHLAYKPLKCEYCTFRHFAMSKIRRHTAKVHPDKSVKVSYHPISDIGSQVKDMKVKCFGALASSTVWDKYMNDGETLHTQHIPEGTNMSNGHGDFSSLMDVSDAMPLPVGAESPNQSLSPAPVSQMLDQLIKDNSNIHNLAGHKTPRPVQQFVDMKSCALCHTQVANTPVAFENHACKHSDYKPFACSYCVYKSYQRDKVVRHIQQAHNRLPIRVSHKPQPSMRRDIDMIRLQCFPFLASHSNGRCNTGASKDILGAAPMSNVQVNEVTCNLCNHSCLALEDSMDEHLHSHITEKYYHCPVCTYQTTFLIRAKQHVHSAHPTSQESRILCCPSEGLPGLQNLRVQCFGTEVWSLVRSKQAALNGTGRESVPDQQPPQPQHQVNNASSQGVPADRMACHVCNALVQHNYPSLTAHARTHMVDYKPYQCQSCHFTAPNEQDVKQHIVNNHKNAPLRAVYNPENKSLQQMYERCFPTANVSKTNSQVSENWRSNAEASLFTGNTMLKKLTCQVCKNTIADNPKSIGIHVKNHLNYKPYRCPHCKYMSCEQSKARRHVEHVHNVSGDTVEIHVEDNIKERIVEMKARCFPTLVGDMDTAEDSQTYVNSPLAVPDPTSAYNYANMPTDNSVLGCELCGEQIHVTVLEQHIKTHMHKPLKCDYCPARFANESRGYQHLSSHHPGYLLKFARFDEDTAFGEMRSNCFPSLFPPSTVRSPKKTGRKQAVQAQAQAWLDESSSDDILLSNLQDPQIFPDVPAKSNLSRTPQKQQRESPSLSTPVSQQLADGRLTCRVCDQPVSVNPNSLDVHAKTHLNFKQHQCGYCSYRSCMSAKVKRHLENVHRGLEGKQTSLSSLPPNVRHIVNEMRAICFPQLESSQNADSVNSATMVASEVDLLIEQVRVRLVDALQTAGNDSALDVDQRTAALNAATSVDAQPADQVRPSASESGMFESMNGSLHDQLPTQVSSSNGFLSEFGRSDTPTFVKEEEDWSRDGGDRQDKLQCGRCMAWVVDSPSALGLHVRNHVVDYKPYSCKLCEYRSGVQGKVLTHVQQVHQADLNQVAYEPEAEMQSKVNEMKVQCFALAMEPGRIGDLDEPEQFVNGATGVQQREDSDMPNMNGSSLLDTLLNSSLTSGLLSSLQVPHQQTSVPDNVTCQQCAAVVVYADTAKLEHALTHTTLWHCSDCDYHSINEQQVKSHTESEHSGSQAQPIRLGEACPELLSAAEQMELVEQCFQESGHPNEPVLNAVDDEDESNEDCDAEDDDDRPHTLRSNKAVEGPRYMCQLCGQAVSVYASSLYVHVKNHMNYKPYSCAYCDYRSPVKSKVRRHTHNAHSDQPLNINFFPKAGIEQEIMKIKRKCFPDIVSLTTSTNDKVPCAVCKVDVADTTLSKQVHAKNHLDAKPFHCAYCTYRSCLRGETRRHVARQHAGQAVRILYRDEENVPREKITAMINQCFASKLSDDDKPMELDSQLGKNGVGSRSIKLGAAFREWYCLYCPYSDTSKYHVKQHVLVTHPGQPVQVSGQRVQA